MMTFLLIIIFMGFLFGFVVLSGQLAKPVVFEESREQFLKDMVDFLEGTLETSGEHDASSRISFNYEGSDFVFEDIEMTGFKDVTFKGYLRLQTKTKLTLSFLEKKQKGFKSGSSFRTSHSDNRSLKSEDIVLPKGLDMMSVTTNAPEKVSLLLKDRQVVKILKKFKNKVSRGFETISLKVTNGMLILEFEEIDTFNPSLSKLRKKPESIEAYVVLLRDLAQKIDQK